MASSACIPRSISFKPLYDAGHLAIVHAAGSPDMSRSHFDAQDYMESGTPGIKSTQDGWLNRALQAEDLIAATARTPPSAHSLSALKSLAPSPAKSPPSRSATSTTSPSPVAALTLSRRQRL